MITDSCRKWKGFGEKSIRIREEEGVPGVKQNGVETE